MSTAGLRDALYRRFSSKAELIAWRDTWLQHRGDYTIASKAEKAAVNDILKHWPENADDLAVWENRRDDANAVPRRRKDHASVSTAAPAAFPTSSPGWSWSYDASLNRTSASYLSERFTRECETRRIFHGLSLHPHMLLIARLYEERFLSRSAFAWLLLYSPDLTAKCTVKQQKQLRLNISHVFNCVRPQQLDERLQAFQPPTSSVSSLPIRHESNIFYIMCRGLMASTTHLSSFVEDLCTWKAGVKHLGGWTANLTLELHNAPMAAAATTTWLESFDEVVWRHLQQISTAVARINEAKNDVVGSHQENEMEEEGEKERRELERDLKMVEDEDMRDNDEPMQRRAKVEDKPFRFPREAISAYDAKERAKKEALLPVLDMRLLLPAMSESCLDWGLIWQQEQRQRMAQQQPDGILVRAPSDCAAVDLILNVCAHSRHRYSRDTCQSALIYYDRFQAQLCVRQAPCPPPDKMTTAWVALSCAVKMQKRFYPETLHPLSRMPMTFYPCKCDVDWIPSPDLHRIFEAEFVLFRLLDCDLYCMTPGRWLWSLLRRLRTSKPHAMTVCGRW